MIIELLLGGLGGGLMVGAGWFFVEHGRKSAWRQANDALIQVENAQVEKIKDFAGEIAEMEELVRKVEKLNTELLQENRDLRQFGLSTNGKAENHGKRNSRHSGKNKKH